MKVNFKEDNIGTVNRNSVTLRNVWTSLKASFVIRYEILNGKTNKLQFSKMFVYDPTYFGLTAIISEWSQQYCGEITRQLHVKIL
jgi:hypothetical protein